MNARLRELVGRITRRHRAEGSTEYRVKGYRVRSAEAERASWRIKDYDAKAAVVLAKLEAMARGEQP